MNKLIRFLGIISLFWFFPMAANAGCDGQFPASTACGTIAAGLPSPIAIRTKLTANTTYYVRTDGNDTNCTGATNAAYTSGSYPQACAVATWNKLYLIVAQTLDFNGNNVTITSGNTGTYTSGLFMNVSWVGGGELIIDGGASTINETVTKGIINNVVQSGPIYIQNFGLLSSTAFSCIQNSAPSMMYVLANMTIGTCNEGDFEAVNGGNIYVQQPYNVTGASGASNAAHGIASFGSTLSLVGSTATFLTNRTYTAGYVRVSEANIQATSYTTVLGGNTVTGPRYAAQQGGNIFTNGGGATYFPGTSVGTISGGGCYDTVCGNLITSSNALSGDVAMNNTSNFFDGPSMAQGTAGTWLATGTVTFQDTAGAAAFECKLWDGTTVIASSAFNSTAANNEGTMALSGVLASPAANIRMSCKDVTSNNGKIQFNASGTSKDSTVTGIRIN